MDFVENNKLDISNQISSAIKHTAQNLGCHHQTAGFRPYLHVACQDTNILKSLLKVTELLIRQGLYRGCVNGPKKLLVGACNYTATDGFHSLCHMFGCQCNCIVSDHGFTGRRMCSNEYRISHFQVVHSVLLESIQLERKLEYRICINCCYCKESKYVYDLPAGPFLGQVRESYQMVG